MEPIVSLTKGHHIRGRVLFGTEPVRDITINLTGPETQTTTTNEAGEYTFIVQLTGLFTVTPDADPYYTFLPPLDTADIDNGNVDDLDFQAIVVSGYDITGTITDNTVPVADVEVRLIRNGNISYVTYTDINGEYVLHPSADGVHTILPIKLNYTFIPIFRTINEQQLPISGQNFTTTIEPVEKDIAGHVYVNDVAQNNVPVYLRHVTYSADTITLPGGFVPPGNKLYEDALVDYILHEDDTAISLVWALSSEGMLTMLWLDGVPPGTSSTAPINIDTSNDYKFMVSDGSNIWLAGATDDKIVRFRMTDLQYQSVAYDWSEFNHGQGASAFNHGAYDPNGKVWLAPKNSANILSINPATYVMQTIAHGQSGTDLFSKAVSDSAHDAVWLVPKNATHIIRIDCLANTATAIAFNIPTTSNFLDGIIVGNTLYLIPHNYTSVVKIDLTTSLVTYVSLPISNKYYKSLLDNYGYLWMFGSFQQDGVNAIAKLQISSDTITAVDASSEPVAVLQDDIIWLACSTTIVKINTLTNLVQNVDYPGAGRSYSNILSVAEGKNPELAGSDTILYFIPRDQYNPFRLWRNAAWSSSPISSILTNSSGEYRFTILLSESNPVDNYFVELDDSSLNRQGIYVTLDAQDDEDNEFRSYIFDISGEAV